MQQIIDIHVHLSERLEDGLVKFAQLNGLKYNLDELLTTMRKYSVEHGLLLSPPLKGSILPNEEVIGLCAKSQGLLSPVITAEPTEQEVNASISLAENNKRDVKAFKIRLGYVNGSAESPVYDSLYDYAQSQKRPVLFHTGDTAFSNGNLASAHPLTLDRLANKRPELTIVLCHFGNPWFDDVAELIYKHPNVYTDISGLSTGERGYADKYLDWLAKKISEAIYYAGGAEKVMFGTDYPVMKHSDALTLVKRLQVEQRDKDKILWQNAKRMFRF